MYNRDGNSTWLFPAAIFLIILFLVYTETPTHPDVAAATKKVESKDVYREADSAILCNPRTGQAFFAGPGTGYTTYLKRVPKEDSQCYVAKN